MRSHDRFLLGAHVRRVDPAVLGGGARERDELLGARVRRGRVLERARHTDGALTHGLRDERLHLLELGGRRRAIAVADHHLAHGRGADIGREIDADSLPLEPREVAREVGPVALDAVVLVRLGVLARDRIVHRSDRLAFAGDLRGDALEDLRRHLRVDEQGELGLPEHVDEARRDDPAGRIDAPLRGGLIEPADGGDAAAADADIRRVPGAPVPSMTWPCSMMRSKGADAGQPRPVGAARARDERRAQHREAKCRAPGPSRHPFPSSAGTKARS